MSSPINSETLEHLAELARVELSAAEKEKLLHDLGDSLGHFAELAEPGLKQEVGDVKPFLTDVFREDGERENTNQGAGKESFPAEKKGYLKVPPVFEE